MALTLNFTFSATCSGGNHFTATATFTPGGTDVYQISRAEIAQASTPEERRIGALVILRSAANQLPGQTQAQWKTKIEAKTYNLTVGP